MTAEQIIDPHKNGTYAALYLSAKSARELASWLDAKGIAHDDPEEFHCTVLYSRTPFPQAEGIAGPVSVTASVVDWKLLGDHATVILVNCAKADQMHNMFMKQGASHDWPQYLPHVTVNSEVHLPQLPEHKPDFTLHFDQLIVKPIDSD
jgi:hypothetical protein